MLALITFGLYWSTVPFDATIVLMPNQSAILTIVPKFPGSLISSRISAKEFAMLAGFPGAFICTTAKAELFPSMEPRLVSSGSETTITSPALLALLHVLKKDSVAHRVTTW